MKKGFALLLLCGVMGITGCSGGNNAAESNSQQTESVQQTEAEMNGDFRSATWGMNKEEIKKMEGKPKEENDISVLFESEVANFPVSVLYTFDEDKLVYGSYHFEVEHTNNNLYYEDYKKLVDIYTEKYGTPNKQTDNWSNDLYKDDPTEWGRAIAAGHVTFVTKWETDTTSVSIVLIGDNFDISLGALYQDKNYESKTDTNGI